MSIEKNQDSGEADKARDLLSDAIESLSEGFALYDEDRRLVMFNKRYKEMNQGIADILEPGLDWEILMRETARRGIYTDAIGEEEKWVSERLENGVEYIQDYELSQTDGKSYLVSVHSTELGGFVVTKTDITERKKAELIEHDSDLLIRTVLDASAAVVTMVRVGDGYILYRTPAALDLFGNTKFAGEHYTSTEQRADFVTQILSDGLVNDFRLNLFNGDGEEFPASMSARIVEYKGEEVIVSSVIDLTEQIKSEALVRQVLESCPAPVQMTKVEGGELIFSSYGSDASSIAAEISRSDFKIENGREKFLDKLRKKGWLSEHKTELVDENGKHFWGSISANLIEFRGEEVIVSSTRDLTDELALQEELSNQRELLFQNEKMSALGELLAGVAHELNNPLSIVVGHSLMLQEDATDPEIVRRIGKISNAAERCSKIVKTFLAMARQQPTKMEQTDINSVISTAVDVAGYSARNEQLQIESVLDPDLPFISADADQITQVVINLIINAEQAIKSAGTGDYIRVATSVNKKQNSVEILVEDNGPGIPSGIKARIFEPFFTTKNVGDGTGIGLAFCHRIILSHQGQIWLDHDYSGGSRFVIRLPITKEIAEDAAQAQDPTGNGKNIKVLVVDDEADVAEINSEVLTKEGFEVDIALSGSAALELLSEESYDILLSDLNMPEVDGRGLYDSICRDFPSILKGTAFITGDTMGETSQRLLKESKRPFLEKPVSPTELRELVYSLLENIRGEL
ncbi:MAG: ATP-binding protein [Rhizobiaceae bacterium]